jgi:hypothetical protein
LPNRSTNGDNGKRDPDGRLFEAAIENAMNRPGEEGGSGGRGGSIGARARYCNIGRFRRTGKGSGGISDRFAAGGDITESTSHN